LPAAIFLSPFLACLPAACCLLLAAFLYHLSIPIIISGILLGIIFIGYVLLV
jgi:hypothetical protein